MGILAIACTFLVGSLGTVIGIKWKDLNKRGKLAIIFLILCLGIIALYSFNQYQNDKREEKINSTYGDLKSEYTQYPAVGIGFTIDAAKIITGADGVFSIADIRVFKAYVKNNKLYVDMVIRDSLGNPIITIQGNEWTKYQDAYEFNNDDNALELVTKGDRNVLFHLKLVNGIVYIEGTFYVGVNKGFNFFTGNKWDGFQMLGPGVYPNNEKMRRIFKYPRERYLGVREENN